MVNTLKMEHLWREGLKVMSSISSSSFSVELLSQVVDIEYRCMVALPFNILTKSPFH